MQRLKKLIKKLFEAQAVRYIASSCTAFAVNYAVALIIEEMLGGFAFAIEVATAISFALSSQVNFWINRAWVFKSKKPPLPELGGYYSLALVSFAVKTYVFIELMYRVLRLPLSVAMPIAEVVMFAVNFIVQKKLIFRRREK